MREMIQDDDERPLSVLQFASNRTLVVSLLATLIVDLVTKQWAIEVVRPAKISVVNGFFAFQYSQNYGAIGGAGENIPDPFRVPFFVLITALTTLAIALYARTSTRNSSLDLALLGITLGGAFGNLTDRVRHGYVVDFISIHWHDSFYWPNFNIADIALVIGIFGLLTVGVHPRPHTPK
ncbi:signal peptidase II [bacterium AH-315-F18]|nr:signal peptidase II [bacterium AH-315-F18]